MTETLAHAIEEAFAANGIDDEIGRSFADRVRAETKKVPALMGVAEAAEALGTTTSNLGNLVGLPEPAQRLACGSIWRAADIEAFARERAARRRRTNG